jgi:hypothetical protein
MRIVHSRVQHGVGQGSFHSASLEVETDAGRCYRYDYVYDCGALKGWDVSPALRRSIKRADLAERAGSGGRPVIDALVLSHYDRDHIIGAALLAKKFVVRRIFVPFLSPTELTLVVAGQAERLTAGEITELQGLALGGPTLFGVPVTMITPGDGDADPGLAIDSDGQPPGTDDRGDVTRGPPRSLRAVVGSTGRAPGRSLASTRNVQLVSGHPGIPPLWKLRFWNRGVSDELVAYLSEALVKCGFPLAALVESTATDEVVDWLEYKRNREATLQAYRDAIALYKPAWAGEASGRKLANFLSLGLYSGPETPNDIQLLFYESNDDRDGYLRRLGRRMYRYREFLRDDDSGRFGWLGTGDAPLGEPGVWADFSGHYTAELKAALTVQVPHHGAAPRHGPKFYNAGLHPEPGMNAVISVGKTNPYGHPTVKVVKEVMATRCALQVVTEDSGLGFHEVVVIET